MNPRQIQLLQFNVYGMLAETLGDTGESIIDGGAHVGETTDRLARLFPSAAIHAFEPVSSSFAELERRCAANGASAHRLALADERAQIAMHVNKNLWTCSLLPANERAREFHGDWCDTVREETVSTVRLDDWAEERELGDVALIKLDLQGYELAALRGAEKLLGRTRAVYSEAQLSPEYRGASTFAEIDLFLRDRGFALYQIVDLCLKGSHCEPSCCDGVWLRTDVFDRARRGPVPRAIRESRDTRSLAMAAALDLCAARGAERVAIYGAGAHTRACGASLADSPVEIAAVLDDARHGQDLWGFRIEPLDAVTRLDVDALVLSSDRAEHQLLDRARPFIARGMPVVTLHSGSKPRWIASST